MQDALPAWVSYVVYALIAAAGIAIVLAATWPHRK